MWYNIVMKADTSSNQNQSEYIHQPEEKCKTQEEKIIMLEQKMDWLLEQIRLGKHKQFGPSSEKNL